MITEKVVESIKKEVLLIKSLSQIPSPTKTRATLYLRLLSNLRFSSVERNVPFQDSYLIGNIVHQLLHFPYQWRSAAAQQRLLVIGPGMIWAAGWTAGRLEMIWAWRAVLCDVDATAIIWYLNYATLVVILLTTWTRNFAFWFSMQQNVSYHSPSHFKPCLTKPKSISPQKSQKVGVL